MIAGLNVGVDGCFAHVGGNPDWITRRGRIGCLSVDALHQTCRVGDRSHGVVLHAGIVNVRSGFPGDEASVGVQLLVPAARLIHQGGQLHSSSSHRPVPSRYMSVVGAYGGWLSTCSRVNPSRCASAQIWDRRRHMDAVFSQSRGLMIMVVPSEVTCVSWSPAREAARRAASAAAHHGSKVGCHSGVPGR